MHSPSEQQQDNQVHPKNFNQINLNQVPPNNSSQVTMHTLKQPTTYIPHQVAAQTAMEDTQTPPKNESPQSSGT